MSLEDPIPEELYECPLPDYPGFRFRKFSIKEIARLGPSDLDVLPDGRHESWAGVIMELYASGRKPRMFRKEEFEKLFDAGIIRPEENARLIDGYILVPGWRVMTEAEVEAFLEGRDWRKLGGRKV